MIGLVYSLAVIVASNPHYVNSNVEEKWVYKTSSSSGPTPIVLWHGMGLCFLLRSRVILKFRRLMLQSIEHGLRKEATQDPYSGSLR